jgi:putative acetyltransferase
MNAAAIVVCEADPKVDMDGVRALFRQYISELDEDLSFQGFDEKLQSLPGEYSWPSGSLYLAWADEQPVGCIAIRSRKRCICSLHFKITLQLSG